MNLFWRSKNREVFRHHLRDVLFVCGASYMSHVNLLLDQLFVGALGASYLHFHVYVASTGLVAFALGRAIGNAVLVTSGKDACPNHFGVGLMLAALLACGVALVLLFLRDGILRLSDLPRPIASRYYLIFVGISSCEILKCVSSSAMVHLGLNRHFPRLSAISLGINVGASALAFLALDRPEDRFVGVGLGTFFAILCPLLLSFRYVRRSVPLQSNRLEWSRIKRIWLALRGEGLYLITLSHVPLLVLAVLQKFYGSDVVSAYGVGQRICALLMAPWYISVTQTVKNISGHFYAKHVWDDFLAAGARASWLLTGFPLIAAGLIGVCVLPSARWEVLALTIVLPARQLFQVMAHRAVVLSRIREVSERMAAAEFVWSGLACGAMLWGAAMFGAPVAGLLGSFLLSGLGFLFSVRLLSKSPVASRL